MIDTLLSSPLLLVAGAVLLTLGVLNWKRYDPSYAPYEKRASLLTPAELKFYRVLRDAVDGNWHICAMVRLADLIQVRPKTAKASAWGGKIRSKHIDFVLCDKLTMTVVLAIELDDKSHQRPDRRDRDDFLHNALSAAGLPLMRVLVADQYDKDQLQSRVIGALK